jgi:hypothetical protein
MNKDKLFTKKIKKQFLSINHSIESFFNQIKPFINRIKKSKFDPNNKNFLFFGIIVIVVFTFFSIPSFYDKNIIQSKIKDQILNKYDVEVRFNDKVSFSFFPKPHFISKDFSILKDDQEIAKVNKLKIYISNEKYFSFNEIKIRDLILDNADFDLNKKNFDFFKKFLVTDPNKENVVIKNSQVFFKDLADDTLFILKIKEGKIFYDYNNLENILISKNEIFNLPFSLEVKNQFFEKKLITNFSFGKIKLNIENQINYKDKNKNGVTSIGVINKNTKFNYKFDEKSLVYKSEVSNFYKGKVEFKPFYLLGSFNYENLDIKNLMNNKFIIMEFLKSEILNNQNLNIDLNLIVKNLLNTDRLNNLDLKIGIVEGYLNLSNTSLRWREDLTIKLNESYLDISENEVNLIGKLIFEFRETKNFYSFYQVKKDNRKDIKNIEIDFLYNLNNNNFNFDNPKINNKFNMSLEKLIEKFNRKKNRFFNKITFKNFINEFFKAYAG